LHGGSDYENAVRVIGLVHIGGVFAIGWILEGVWKEIAFIGNTSMFLSSYCDEEMI